ncbi:hypothetical protein BUALT_Bualt06G0112200 [Buddleja alternifolia]|uniref:Uncharacterized protein n=1 Tax=Buddleja alternifolia TaxID=168488 RepID=A0AAV6XQ75_9LAMI|nr:hypothetical protein BUALT_Bualt06G0112200 [Buddleja alternifolia]
MYCFLSSIILQFISGLFFRKMGKKRDYNKEEKKKGRLSLSSSLSSEREGLRKGAWSDEEDKILVDFITKNGHGTWRNLPKFAGLLRCGKSCRLRWANYLRPDIKRGPFSPEEENTIIHLHETLGNKWAAIATHLPGRTDNDIKNFWNSHLRKRFCKTVLNKSPSPSKSINMNSGSLSTRHMVQWESVRVEAESRLSTNPLLDTQQDTTNTKGDHFLSLWNSEVGESFRNVNEGLNEWDGALSSHSSASQTSSLTKVELADQKVGVWKCKKEEGDDVAAYSDSSKSCELDDSPDAMMKLLLDFPVGDVSTYIQDD